MSNVCIPEECKQWENGVRMFHAFCPQDFELTFFNVLLVLNQEESRGICFCERTYQISYDVYKSNIWPEGGARGKVTGEFILIVLSMNVLNKSYGKPPARF